MRSKCKFRYLGALRYLPLLFAASFLLVGYPSHVSGSVLQCQARNSCLVLPIQMEYRLASAPGAKLPEPNLVLNDDEQAYLAERRDMVVYTNLLRTEHGLVPIGTFDLLELAVQRYTLDLARAIGSLNDTCRHGTLDNRRSWNYAETLGIIGGAGEIVACGFPSGRLAIDAWMTSVPHRGIMLSTSYNAAAYGHWATPSGWQVYVGLYMALDPNRYPIYVPGPLSTATATPVLAPTPVPSMTPSPTQIPLPTVTPTLWSTPTPGPTRTTTPLSPYYRYGLAQVQLLVPGNREAFQDLCSRPGVVCRFYR